MASQKESASSPDTRITAIPPVPGAVEMAVMVDFDSNCFNIKFEFLLMNNYFLYSETTINCFYFSTEITSILEFNIYLIVSGVNCLLAILFLSSSPSILILAMSNNE